MSKADVIKELHRNARRHFERRRTIQHGIKDTFQIDLADLQSISQYNNKFKYILVVIDIFSKYAWAIPIKSKATGNIVEALQRLFALGHIPKNIHSDMGGEFYSAAFKNLMALHHVNHYSTYSTKKAAICERFIRTLKTLLWKKMQLLGSYKWIAILHDVLKQYNNTKHSTIKMKPKDVKRKHEQHLLNTVYKMEKIVKVKSAEFSMSQYVRISRHKHSFEKGYTANWSPEIFKICKILHTQPTTYLLQDYEGHEVKGCFYGHELQTVKHPNLYLVERVLRKKDHKFLVKWLGFNNTHNSWVTAKELCN